MEGLVLRAPKQGEVGLTEGFESPRDAKLEHGGRASRHANHAEDGKEETVSEKEALRQARQAKPEPPEGDGLISLKRTKEDMKKEKGDGPVAVGKYEPPQYAYGTKINLCKEELEKLGMESLPDVGKTMRLEAEVEVVSVSQSAGKNSSNREMSLQITAMRLK